MSGLATVTRYRVVWTLLLYELLPLCVQPHGIPKAKPERSERGPNTCPGPLENSVFNPMAYQKQNPKGPKGGLIRVQDQWKTLCSTPWHTKSKTRKVRKVA